MVFCFGDYEVDEARFELRHGTRPVAVQPKVLALLLYLVRNHGRVVPGGELMAAVWPGTHVTDGSLARAISLARVAIGDRERRPPAIATVARRGYRFEAEVRERGAGAPASYVGRASLVARLEERLDRALEGEGRVLLLVGEAGIGKTRTAELLRARATRAGALVAWAAGPEESAPPLASWGQALQAMAAARADAIAALTPAQREAVAALVPELVPVGAPRQVQGEEARRFALRDGVGSFLGAVCRTGPLALFLEDLHAADAETLGLLESVGRGVAQLPLAIVATCRDEDVLRAPRQANALERLLRLTTLERWPLVGLERPEVHALARAQLGAELDAALLEALERQTGGNPLLIGESLRSLEARGLLGTTRSRSDWEALLPRGIRHLLLPKLRRVSPDAREVLACAAALGNEVDPVLVGRCVAEGTAVDAGLAEAVEATLLLAPIDDGALRFSHALVREALYEELVPVGSRRRALHARISRALEEGAASMESLAERALHACEGVPEVPASHAAELAARAAAFGAERLDFEGASAWYERALGLVGAGDPARRAPLLLGLGEAEIRALGLDRARPTLRAAAEEAKAIARPDWFAAAALGFAHRPSSTGQEEGVVIELLTEAAAELPADDPLGIRVRSRLAVELRYAQPARAEQLMEEAVAAARRLGDARTLAQALDDSSFVRWSPADPEAWCVLNAEVVRVAGECRDLELALSGRRGVVTGRLEQGRRAALDREVAACTALATAIGTPQARWFRLALDAMRSLLDGDLDAAEALIGNAMAVGAQLDANEVAVEVGAQLAYLRLEQGRASEWLDAVRAQRRRFPGNTAWRAALCLFLASADGAAEAREELQTLARGRFEDIPRDRGHLPTLAMAAGAAHRLGEERVAAHLVERLLPYADLHVVIGSGLLYYGTVGHALGLALATAGRTDEATVRLERAIEAEEAFGAPLWAARARVDCAEVLLARGGATDRRRAASLVNAATARRHGWTVVAERGAALESALWRRRSPRRSGSAREAADR